MRHKLVLANSGMSLAWLIFLRLFVDLCLDNTKVQGDKTRMLKLRPAGNDNVVEVSLCIARN